MTNEQDIHPRYDYCVWESIRNSEKHEGSDGNYEKNQSEW